MSEADGAPTPEETMTIAAAREVEDRQVCSSASGRRTPPRTSPGASTRPTPC